MAPLMSSSTSLIIWKSSSSVGCWPMAFNIQHRLSQSQPMPQPADRFYASMQHLLRPGAAPTRRSSRSCTNFQQGSAPTPRSATSVVSPTDIRSRSSCLMQQVKDTYRSLSKARNASRHASISSCASTMLSSLRLSADADNEVASCRHERRLLNKLSENNQKYHSYTHLFFRSTYQREFVLGA